MTPPLFGEHAPDWRVKLARSLGAHLGRDPLSKIARSLLKHLALTKRDAPFDVTVFDTHKARLHPYDNICEKRVLLTPHLWESDERKALKSHISFTQHTEYYFVDAGANVGLYTLYARTVALKNNKTFKAICIEPGDSVRSRLEFNMTASIARNDVQVFPYAVSNKTGTVTFAKGAHNLGESKITTDAHSGPTQNIVSKTLLDIVETANFPRIDGLKIDIEGHEYIALEAFLKTAPKHLWPSFIIIETAHATSESGITLLLAESGYTLDQKTRGNVIFSRQSPIILQS